MDFYELLLSSVLGAAFSLLFYIYYISIKRTEDVIENDIRLAGIQFYSNAYDYIITMGRIKACAGKHREATIYFRKAIELAPEKKDPWFYLGIIELLHCKPSCAIAYFTESEIGDKSSNIAKAVLLSRYKVTADHSLKTTIDGHSYNTFLGDFIWDCDLYTSNPCEAELRFRIAVDLFSIEEIDLARCEFAKWYCLKYLKESEIIILFYNLLRIWSGATYYRAL